MGILLKEQSESEIAAGSTLVAALPPNPKPWYRTRHLLRLNVTLLVLLVSAASVGFDGSMMNGLQTLPQWRGYFGHPNGALLGAMNAVYPVGKVCGLLPVTWISDHYGRKAPILAGFILLLIGTVIQTASQNLAMFIVSRFWIGVSTVFLSQPCPILVTELAYPTHRAKYVGAIIAAWSTYGTFRLDSSWSWRIPSALQGALPLIQVSFFWLVPESPRWLVAKKRIEEAREVLTKHHAGGDVTSLLVEFELKEIEESIAFEELVVSESSYMDLIRTPANRKRTFIAFVVGFGAQWNGGGVISYYLTLVLNTIGITSVASQALINGLLQIFNWFASVLAGALMVDRLGRRTLFLWSVGGMLVSYIIWTALSSYFNRTLDQNAGNAVVAFIFIYYFFYDIAWNPLLQAYPVEIFPYSLRGRGLTVTLGSTYVGLIIGQFINPVAMNAIGWQYYIVFCCLLGILFAIVWFMFPETKGHSLEEIAQIFDGKRPDATDELKYTKSTEARTETI
ncbi:hypothetical protein V500_10802 [Pseudogymnoascus sp. VKM F-4518 (FW-2643)]|nr:hypothetical protein V500_10802 [Pseudogymnoascus sp. VKM F-4518 (FW-2643)]